jgi:hypothetical protein
MDMGRLREAAQLSPELRAQLQALVDAGNTLVLESHDEVFTESWFGSLGWTLPLLHCVGERASVD